MGIRIQQKVTCDQCKKAFYWTVVPENTNEILAFAKTLSTPEIEVKCSHCESSKSVDIGVAVATAGVHSKFADECYHQQFRG